MSKKARSDLKAEFQTGAIPTASGFADLIDSALNLSDDGVTVDTATNRVSVGGARPMARLNVQGGFDVALTGTLAAAASTAANQVVAITGTGTKFTSELAVGLPLLMAGQVWMVAAIASDTQMTASRINAGPALPAGPAFARGAIFELRDAAGATQVSVGPVGHVSIGAAGLGVRGLVLAQHFRGDGSAITGLDAAKITAGQVDAARLPASVVSAPIGVGRIPPLDAAAIASGTFDAARLPQTLTVTDLIVAASGAGGPAPGLSWSIIASGGNSQPIMFLNGNQSRLVLDRTGELSVSSLKVTTGDLSVTAGVVSGNGAGLTNLAPANLSGSVTAAKGGTGLTTPGAAGNFLRSNGAAWESTRITAADLPAGTGSSGSYINNGTASQANANFNIGGTGKAHSFDAASFSIAGLTMLEIVNHSVCVGMGQPRTTLGDGNVYVGNGSGASNTGANNTFVGQGAGFSVSKGAFSTFIGVSAGLSCQTGYGNSALGAFTGINDGLSNATAIGANAMVTRDNSLILGSIAGSNGAPYGTKIGIGVTAPDSLLTLKPALATEPALEISQGAIKVTGAGLNTHTCVFIHAVTAANVDSTSPPSTLLDHPLTNGDSAAILMITPLRTAGQSVPKAVYVDYSQTAGKWRINHLDASTMTAGEHFNVLVFKS